MGFTVQIYGILLGIGWEVNRGYPVSAPNFNISNVKMRNFVEF